MDDFTSIIGFIPAEYHSTILAALTVAGLALPLLQWIANKTANTWDNALVARIEWVLARVPRIGFGNTQRAKEAVQRTSVKPPPVPPEALALLMTIATPLALTFVLQACAGAEKTMHDARDKVAQMRERSAAAARSMRADLHMARGVLDACSSSVYALCSFQRVEACETAEDSIRVIDAGYKAAMTAVDTIEETGLVLDTVVEQVRGVVVQVTVLGETVRALGSEVANAVDQGTDRASAPSDSGSASSASHEGSAPATAAP